VILPVPVPNLTLIDVKKKRLPGQKVEYIYQAEQSMMRQWLTWLFLFENVLERLK
jgi:hypothetical protein